MIRSGLSSRVGAALVVGLSWVCLPGTVALASPSSGLPGPAGAAGVAGGAADDLSEPAHAAPRGPQVQLVPRDELKSPRRHLRNGAAMLAGLGLGAAWYWIDREHNLADWDYPAWQQRFTYEAVRFDNNSFPINFAWHPVSGAAYQLAGRANGLGLGWSFAYNLGTSTAWEYVLEFREKVSINDMIVTPLAGLSIGEFMHRVGQVLAARGAGGTAFGRALAWLLAPQLLLADRLEGQARWARADATARHHWFRARASIGVATASSSAGTVGLMVMDLGAEVVAIPGFAGVGGAGKATHADGWFQDAEATRGWLRVGLGPVFEVAVQPDSAGVQTAPSVPGRMRLGETLELFADTMLFGWQLQRWSPVGQVNHALLMGSSVAFLYRRETLPQWRDRLGLMHLPGPALDGILGFGSARLRFRVRGHFDLAGIHAEPFERWRQAHLDERPKTILRKQGYYYGWGWSGRAELALAWRSLELGVRTFAARHDSQERFDRSQEVITADVPCDDSTLEAGAWLRLQSPLPWPSLVLEARATQRRARVGEFESYRRLDRLDAQLGYLF